MAHEWILVLILSKNGNEGLSMTTSFERFSSKDECNNVSKEISDASYKDLFGVVHKPYTILKNKCVQGK